VALPSDAAAIEATLLINRQQADELRADRSVALTRLSSLTGRRIDDDATLAIPDLASAVAGARPRAAQLHARPEYQQFERSREVATRQQDVQTANDRPQLSAYAKVGYGKPGLNFLSTEFETYGLAGIQLQWRAWNWKTVSRERDALGLQQSIVSADEAAFSEALGREVQADFTNIDRLERSVAGDDRIVALREDIQRTTRARFQEGVVTASEYLDRNTERLNAVLARSRHLVELAETRARVLTTLGLEVQ